MVDHRSVAIDTGTVNVVFTNAADGNFQIDSDKAKLQDLRSKIVPFDWTWFKQVHGATVMSIDAAGEHAGIEADGSVTSKYDTPISITTADCSPVVMVGSNAIGAVHAGWKSLELGIIQKCAYMLKEMGSEPVVTLLGPHITCDSYEFSVNDISRIESKLGSGVRGVTSDGKPALNMYAGVVAACREAGWPIPDKAPSTRSEDYFSYRLRQDEARQVTVAWISQG